MGKAVGTPLWVQIPACSLTSHVTSNDSLYRSVLQFPRLQRESRMGLCKTLRTRAGAWKPCARVSFCRLRWYYFSVAESALSAGGLQPCLVDTLVLGHFPVYLTCI